MNQETNIQLSAAELHRVILITREKRNKKMTIRTQTVNKEFNKKVQEYIRNLIEKYQGIESC